MIDLRGAKPQGLPEGEGFRGMEEQGYSQAFEGSGHFRARLNL
jgi:hypothetical protein